MSLKLPIACFRAYKTTTQNVSNATATVIVFDTQDFLEGGGSSYDTGNGVYTAGSTGRYLVVAAVQFTSTAGGTVYANIRRNASIVAETTIAGSAGQGIFISDIVNVTSPNTTIDITVYQNSGGTRTIDNGANYKNYFAIYKLM